MLILQLKVYCNTYQTLEIVCIYICMCKKSLFSVFLVVSVYL